MCIMVHLKVTERLSEVTTGAVYCCSISHVCIVVLYGFDSCVGACHCSAGSHSGFKSVSPFGFCAAKRVMSEEPVPKKPRVEDNPPSAPLRVDQMASGWTKQRCAAVS